MKYKIGDLVELYSGHILTVDLVDDKQADSVDNRGLFEYINELGRDGRPVQIHSYRNYNEDWIMKVHGNIYTDGLDLIDKTGNP